MDHSNPPNSRSISAGINPQHDPKPGDDSPADIGGPLRGVLGPILNKDKPLAKTGNNDPIPDDPKFEKRGGVKQPLDLQTRKKNVSEEYLDEVEVSIRSAVIYIAKAQANIAHLVALKYTNSKVGQPRLTELQSSNDAIRLLPAPDDSWRKLTMHTQPFAVALQTFPSDLIFIENAAIFLQNEKTPSERREMRGLRDAKDYIDRALTNMTAAVKLLRSFPDDFSKRRLTLHDMRPEALERINQDARSEFEKSTGRAPS